MCFVTEKYVKYVELVTFSSLVIQQLFFIMTTFPMHLEIVETSRKTRIVV